jgi:ATP-dependent Lhr-like helicase
VNIEDWFKQHSLQPAPFQRELWEAYGYDANGLVIAPTGAGKTYGMMGAIVTYAQQKHLKPGGLRVLWITPLRALAKDISAAVQTITADTLPEWQTALRTGDTSQSVKVAQRKQLPEILITTPESLHILLSYKGATALFKDLACIVVDEWHELYGSKRGTMMQLALAHLQTIAPDMHVWGMSATIGNIDQASQGLLSAQNRPTVVVKDQRPKPIMLETVLPESIERFPWAGHMGDTLLPQVLQIIHSNRSTLIFTNTRNQAESWYRKLLAADAELAGRIALHHGSLASDQRAWVEAALHDGKVLAVVATSSLDLGVDFRPVDTVIQIGGPKGVARFLQRAGRSGHAPGETSRMYFVPTNSLELIEAAALREAVAGNTVEAVLAPELSLDVLTQWLITLGVGDGFEPSATYKTVKKTQAYRHLTQDVWEWALEFVSSGGSALGNYEQYQKLKLDKQGTMRAQNRQISNRHRLAIGAITSTTSIPVQVLRGSVLGSIEESFVANLQPGQTFWFAGRPLSFLRVRDNKAWVTASRTKQGITPSWVGGRLPLSSQLAVATRMQVEAAEQGKLTSPELQALKPLLAVQSNWSHIPKSNELLVEQFQTREGQHIVIYPFEGRAIHEILAALIASRLGVDPNTFSFAFNDYGFELLAAKSISIDESAMRKLFSTKNLDSDVKHAINEGSLPRRQFRSIAIIAGLINSGRPGKPQSNRHLQASSEMIYDVLREYDPDNQLLQQANDEVLAEIVDISRLQQTLERLQDSQIVMTHPPHPTPFAFPLMSERIRERLSTETYTERLQRMQAQLERYVTAA